jgi:hypothetical protein
MNRCDHDPRAPRLQLATAPAPRRPFPWIISHALDRIEGLYTDRSLFPELGERKRSERIEAMVLVGKALLRNTDRLTLRAGRRLADGSMVGITMHTIAAWAQLKRQRAYRALWDLRDAGYVRCSQPIERRADGSRRGLAGIRCFTRHFFDRLRLGGRLRRERAQLYQAARAHHHETIAERRRLRRLFRTSERAAQLATRTVRQLATAATPAAPAVYTPADIAARLAAWRREQ